MAPAFEWYPIAVCVGLLVACLIGMYWYDREHGNVTVWEN